MAKIYKFYQRNMKFADNRGKKKGTVRNFQGRVSVRNFSKKQVSRGTFGFKREKKKKIKGGEDINKR